MFVGVRWEPGAMGASGAAGVSSPWGDPGTWVHRSLARGGATTAMRVSLVQGGLLWGLW